MLRSIKSLVLVLLVCALAPFAFSSTTQASVVGGAPPFPGSTAPLYAYAVIAAPGPSPSAIHGSVILREQAPVPHNDERARTVNVIANITGLPAGAHGIQITTNADCSGGDFDPTATPSAANHPNHIGDLPNLTDNGNGSFTLKFTTNRFTISAGNSSVLNAPTSIAIRNAADPGNSSGNGGALIACGAIVLGNPNIPVPTPVGP